MIKKTALTAIGLFLSYAIFVKYFEPDWWTASQHQWQDNVIKAQRYIYNEKFGNENVIIGSSLSSRLIMDSLPNTYNLSFQGQSIFDGLNILNHSATVPKNVFVEINTVLKDKSKEFKSALYSPVFYYSKKVFSSLRDDKQPIGVIGSKINSKVTVKVLNKLKGLLDLDNENIKDQSKILAGFLALQIKDYSKAPDSKLLSRAINKLKKNISKLENRGVNVIFFEVPVNYRLNMLKKPSAIRAAFYNKFPVSKYKYIPVPDGLKYQTTDGVHLNGDEALSYTLYLREKIKPFLQ